MTIATPARRWPWDTADSSAPGQGDTLALFDLVSAQLAWFRDGGATVAAADERGGMCSFPTDPAEPLRRACEIAGRNLTSAEWSEVLPNRPYRQTCPDEPSASE